MAVQKQPLPQGFVEGNLPTPTTGPITVTVTGNPPTSVQLSGSGTGWSADEEGIHLMRGTTSSTVWYQLTLELVQPPQQQTFSLVGVQILHHDPTKPSTENAAIFIPASADQAEINLLHQIPGNGETVTYGMVIGLFNGTTTFWPDPTIAFEPEQG